MKPFGCGLQPMIGVECRAQRQAFVAEHEMLLHGGHGALGGNNVGGSRNQAGAADTGHGLREAFLMDADGYVWVPDVQVRP